MLKNFIRPMLLMLTVLLWGCQSTAPAPEPRPQLNPAVTQLFNQAMGQLKQGELDGAEALLEQVLRLDDKLPGARLNLAIISHKRGDSARAKALIDSALALAPMPEALNLRGVLARQEGDFRAAEADFTKALTQAPGYAAAHYNLALLYDLYLQQPEKAAFHCRQYLAQSGDSEATPWLEELSRRAVNE
ncbi:tetratricopeptide repeat protein [Shewanella cyperi]|uniref:tetratricopeptide repeat protein n=1 Tax=Shewanella cyperi TaxID=2814292 RepID=UPI001A944361|nr:tetratricopeptide repeat protein [Shewanella cyperi]QSX41697.1 tetratricopeptide repeat protein [Shewanella cyperi]